MLWLKNVNPTFNKVTLSSEAMNGSCDFWVEILWIVFNTLQQQSLIASLEMRSLLLVAVDVYRKMSMCFPPKETFRAMAI